MSFKKNIVFEAIPFCFGPIATSLEVAKSLSKKISCEITWLANGTSLKFLKEESSDFPIFECDTTNFEEVKKFYKTLNNSDLIVSNTNPNFAKWCLDFNFRVAYIDILYWMWDRIPSFFNNLNPFIIEKFVGLNEQYQRLGKPKYSYEVGPLIPMDMYNENIASKSNTLLVSFGGITNPFQNYTKHVDIIIELILEIPDIYSFDKIIICGGGIEYSKYYKSFKNSEKFLIKTLSHSEYLYYLKKAHKVLLSPGLTGFYEAYYSQTNPFFLIPHNYSQYLQLLKFKELGLAPYSFNFEEAGIDTDLGLYMEEEVAVKFVLKCLDEFCDRQDAKIKLQEMLSTFLFTNTNYKVNVELSKYLKNIGTDIAADVIMEKLSL